MIADKYAEILHRPHPQSTKHPPMSQWDRAAQFAPFSALSGHAEGAAETARTTQTKVELSADAVTHLTQQLQTLVQQADEHPLISITHFVPDLRKSGGAYVTDTGPFKKIDSYRHMLLLTDGREIPLAEIIALEGALFQQPWPC